MLRWIVALHICAMLLSPIIAIAIAPTAEQLKLLRSDVVLDSTRRTIYLAAAVATCGTLLGFLLAWFIHGTNLLGRRLFSWLFVLPLAIPSYVAAITVLMGVGPGGLFSDLAGEDIYGFWGCFITLMFTFPFAYVIAMAAYGRIDPNYWQAARSLGCGPWRAFRRVIFPGLVRPIGAAFTLIGLYVIGDFGGVSLMRYSTLSELVYTRFKTPFARDDAAVISLWLVILALVFLGIRALWQRRAADHGTEQKKPWPRISLGWWQIPALGFSLLVVSVFVVAPLGLVMYWLFKGIELGASVNIPWDAITYTLKLGIFGGAICTVVAYISVRLLRNRLITAAAATAYALPGIAVAMGFLLATLMRVPWLYQTVFVLVLALALRFLLIAMEVFQGVNTKKMSGLLSAARSLGKSPIAAWYRVELPLSGIVIGGAFLLSFIAIIKELPVTLLLNPPGTQSLSMEVWMLEEDAYFADMGPAILALVAMSITGLLARAKLGSKP